MTDLGDPISYLALEPGTPVYSSDGQQIAVVEHVLEDDHEDVFDGIVLARHEHHGPFDHGGRHSFADADQVAAIHERGVELTIPATECASLPAPSANPAVVHEDPGDRPDRGLHSKLRRAWDAISGNY
jgi:hypothetical protein